MKCSLLALPLPPPPLLRCPSADDLPDDQPGVLPGRLGGAHLLSADTRGATWAAPPGERAGPGQGDVFGGEKQTAGGLLALPPLLQHPHVQAQAKGGGQEGEIT